MGDMRDTDDDLSAGRNRGNGRDYQLASSQFAASAYFLGAAILAAVLLYTLIHPVAVVSFQRDIWHHLAVFDELLRSPFFAENPHIASDDPSRSYTPWAVFIALIGGYFDLDAFGALALAGGITVFALLVSIFLFARRYWQSLWAPVALLFTLFATWGVPVNHTGYHTLTTFVFSIAYPFGIVLAMGFFSWWLVLKTLAASSLNIIYIAFLVALSFGLFVTHQLQGLFAVGAAMGFALFAAEARIMRRLITVLALVCGLAASQYWWYFDPVAYILDPNVRKGHNDERFLSYSLENSGLIFNTIGLAWFGLLGLRLKSLGRLRLELAIPLVVLAAGFIMLLGNGNWVATRVMPFIVLFLQMGLVSYFFQPLSENRPPVVADVFRGCLITVMGFMLIINVQDAWQNYNRAQGFLDSGDITQQPRTWSPDILPAMAFAETLAPRGATAIAYRQTAFPVEASTLKVVSIPRLFAEVADMQERQSATETFFTAETDLATRCEILTRYDVSLIVYHGRWLDDPVQAELAILGTPTQVGDLFFIEADTLAEDQIRFSSCEPS